MYNDSLPCIVTGIVQDNPANTSFLFTDIVSAASIQNTFLNKIYELDNWQNWASKSQTFVKLRQGVQPAQLEKQSIALLKKFYGGIGKRKRDKILHYFVRTLVVLRITKLLKKILGR